MSKSKFYFELNKKGVRHLLYSQKMKEGLQQTAKEVMPNAEDYTVENMPTRSIVIITTENGWIDNTENNTLIKRMKTKQNAFYVQDKKGRRYWKTKNRKKSTQTTKRSKK